jgi:hypothetical protein
VLEGGYARHVAGQTANPKMAMFGAVDLARRAGDLVRTGSASGRATRVASRPSGFG